MDEEITKQHREKFLSILAINFVMLMLINMTGSALGMLLAIGYSVVLFNYGINLLEKLRALNAASSELAKGNLM